jgi:hypothetical protein
MSQGTHKKEPQILRNAEKYKNEKRKRKEKKRK